MRVAVLLVVLGFVGAGCSDLLGDANSSCGYNTGSLESVVKDDAHVPAQVPTCSSAFPLKGTHLTGSACLEYCADLIDPGTFPTNITCTVAPVCVDDDGGVPNRPVHCDWDCS